MSCRYWPTDDITLIYKSDRRGTRISIRNDQKLYSLTIITQLFGQMKCTVNPLTPMSDQDRISPTMSIQYQPDK